MQLLCIGVENNGTRQGERKLFGKCQFLCSCNADVDDLKTAFGGVPAVSGTYKDIKQGGAVAHFKIEVLAFGACTVARIVNHVIATKGKAAYLVAKVKFQGVTGAAFSRLEPGGAGVIVGSKAQTQTKIEGVGGVQICFGKGSVTAKSG